MIARFLFQLMGYFLLAGAFATLIMDTMHSVMRQCVSITSLGENVSASLPGPLVSMKEFVQLHLHPLIWDPILVDLLRLPVWLFLGVLAIIAFKAGAQPPPKFGFSSR